MDNVRIIALKESVLEDNDRDAQALREELRSRGTCLLNLMSSPGSGKTTTLLALNRAFAGRLDRFRHPNGQGQHQNQKKRHLPAIPAERNSCILSYLFIIAWQIRRSAPSPI